MSVGEVTRKIESYNRTHIRDLKEKASFDWTLANLIGISVGRCLSNEVEMPSLEETYPDIFKDVDNKKEINNQKNNVDVDLARFLQFASKHNLKINKKRGVSSDC